MNVSLFKRHIIQDSGAFKPTGRRDEQRGNCFLFLFFFAVRFVRLFLWPYIGEREKRDAGFMDTGSPFFRGRRARFFGSDRRFIFRVLVFFFSFSLRVSVRDVGIAAVSPVWPLLVMIFASMPFFGGSVRTRVLYRFPFSRFVFSFFLIYLFIFHPEKTPRRPLNVQTSRRFVSVFSKI